MATESWLTVDSLKHNKRCRRHPAPIPAPALIAAAQNIHKLLHWPVVDVHTAGTIAEPGHSQFPAHINVADAAIMQRRAARFHYLFGQQGNPHIALNQTHQGFQIAHFKRHFAAQSLQGKTVVIHLARALAGFEIDKRLLRQLCHGDVRLHRGESGIIARSIC